MWKTLVVRRIPIGNTRKSLSNQRFLSGRPFNNCGKVSDDKGSLGKHNPERPLKGRSSSALRTYPSTGRSSPLTPRRSAEVPALTPAPSPIWTVPFKIAPSSS